MLSPVVLGLPFCGALASKTRRTRTPNTLSFKVLVLCDTSWWFAPLTYSSCVRLSFYIDAGATLRVNQPSRWGARDDKDGDDKDAIG